ncbi:MAG: arsenate reductase ArsC [Planctomycetes bacterium]|nr:arsenate reductase ArsC [Planctomycetota bacterium]
MSNPVVLFLCTGNSARSQMAEALLRKEAGDRFDAHSAGTEPRDINPLTVQIMNELGIDISQQRSKHVREYLGRLPVRILVVVCTEAEKTCPTTWPGALQRLFWRFEDPAAVQGTDDIKLSKFREVRDAIHQRIKEWLAETAAP